MKVGYFATAGYTEVGGLQRFLEALRPDLTWERCFPAAEKPGPKIGKIPVPRSAEGGVTGDLLLDRTDARLRGWYRGRLDAVLIVDDADCRFRCEDCASPCAHERFAGLPCKPNEAPAIRFEDALHATTRRMREAAGDRDLPVILLLASPEIEAWFVADWEGGFGRHFSDVSGSVGRAVQHALGVHIAQRGVSEIETYGGGLQNGSCRAKLSEDLVDLLGLLPGEERARYSKKVDGPSILQNIRPAVIEERCTRYAAPALRALRALAATPDGPPR